MPRRTNPLSSRSRGPLPSLAQVLDSNDPNGPQLALHQGESGMDRPPGRIGARRCRSGDGRHPGRSDRKSLPRRPRVRGGTSGYRRGRRRSDGREGAAEGIASTPECRLPSAGGGRWPGPFPSIEKTGSDPGGVSSHQPSVAGEMRKAGSNGSLPVHPSRRTTFRERRSRSTASRGMRGGTRNARELSKWGGRSRVHRVYDSGGGRRRSGAARGAPRPLPLRGRPCGQRAGCAKPRE